MSELIGFRGSRERHYVIFEWLDRFEHGQKSEEIRRLLELGIRVSKGDMITPKEIVTTPVVETVSTLDWTRVFEQHTTPKSVPSNRIESNLLIGFD